MKNDFRNDGSQSWEGWQHASDEPEQDPLDGWKNYFYGIDLGSHDAWGDQTAFCMISPDGLVGFTQEGSANYSEQVEVEYKVVKADDDVFASGDRVMFNYFGGDGDGPVGTVTACDDGLVMVKWDNVLHSICHSASSLKKVEPEFKKGDVVIHRTPYGQTIVKIITLTKYRAFCESEYGSAYWLSLTELYKS